jgi:hypothetical protein
MMFRQLTCVLLVHVLFFSLILLMTSGLAHADFYKYTDNTGAVCISNTLDAVPKQYRSTMKVVRDDSLEKKDPGARRSSPPAASPSPAGQPQKTAPSSGSMPSEPQQKDVTSETSSPAGAGTPASQPWRQPLMYGGALVALFLVVRKVVASISSPQLSRVIYLAFFLGVFAFGFKLYADHVVNGYFTAKTRIMAMFEKANRREAPPVPVLPGSQEGTE